MVTVVRSYESKRVIIMRKLKLFNIVLICLLLVGCVSTSERDLTISELRNNDIIDKSWELTDTWTESAAPVPGIAAYMYAYYDSEADSYCCIRVPAIWSTDIDDTKYINVSVYRDATIEVKEYKQYDRRTDSYITHKERMVSDYSDMETYTVDKTNVFGMLKSLRLEAIN